MPYYNFDDDYKIATKTEEEVAKLLVENYGAEILHFEKTNKYDILARIDGKETTFEVKEDFICERTGNVGLEYECRGKPSGIQTSKADYYIYKLHTKEGVVFVQHETSILKDMIDTQQYFRIINGGDIGSNTMNYLFRYPVFVKNGKFLDKKKKM